MTEEWMQKQHGTNGGWEKVDASPVLGGDYGTCFDVAMLQEDGLFKMYFSWRDKKSIAYTDSKDGIHWSEPQICLEPRQTEQGWEDLVNRPSVLKKDGIYHMWYTGQWQRPECKREGTSHIFHAVSEDGVHFTRTTLKPVLAPDIAWENTSTMNPNVLYDEQQQLFKIWYCAGAQYEPKAIGYATSKDGLTWNKYENNPVFEANPANTWEQHKTAGCQVMRRGDEYLMFYIGYLDENYAQIGIAASKDGIHDWKRCKFNPIIAPTEDAWDSDACYKPFAMPVGNRWMLWYNGRKARKEQIGLAVHEGLDIGI